jgi:hypothetical protein
VVDDVAVGPAVVDVVLLGPEDVVALVVDVVVEGLTVMCDSNVVCTSSR